MADEMNTERDMPEGITRDDTVHGETYYTAEDMATASAQGFRDGVASLSAPLQSAWDVIERWARDAYVVCGKPATQEGFEAAWKAEDADAYAVWVAGRASLAANAPAATAADGKWYMVNKDGMATLCADKADAEREAADAQAAWPHTGPHRAVQLIEADGRASHGQAPVQPQHIEAMERAWLWMENQADGQSKGGHETFDLMMLREERDALRTAIDATPLPQAAQQAPAQAAVRHLEAVIKGAADKLDAAVCCHPNAVDALIHEALEILDGDRRPDWTPVTKAGA